MPYVTYLYCDDRRNPPPVRNKIPGEQFHPDWEQVKSAILGLDSYQLRMVIISANAPAHDSVLPFAGTGMIIAGGPDVGYICEALDENDTEKVCRAVGNKEQTGTVEIVRGQPTDYERRYCLTREQIVNAAKEFFTSGVLTPTLHWLLEPM